MVKIYCKKIIAGTMLWTEVPSLWQTRVCAELDAMGYVCNEDGTVSPKPINEEEETEEE